MYLCVNVCCGMKSGERDLRKKWTYGFSWNLELFGLCPFTNLLLLAFPFKCPTGTTCLEDLGWSGRTERRWWKLDVPCRACQKHVTFKLGIICANYGTTRGYSQRCRGAWCGECFTAHPLDKFETAVPRDFNGASLAEIEDEVRFRKARAGDHLCTPFQCPMCQSFNIRGKCLVEGRLEDEAFEAVCIRATLDAFWDHSTKTVGGHVREAIFAAKYAHVLDISDHYPVLGPYPPGHHLGMLQAIMVVMRSHERGNKGKGVQFGTARKQRSTGTKIWEASPESGSDIVLSAGAAAGRFVATCNPSEGRWFQHFIKGCCARMGDIVRQDRAFTLPIVHKLLEMYEDEYNNEEKPMSSESLCACLFLLVACLGGMRGFEVVWTDLAALRYDISYCEDQDDYSAIAWPIVGRFKAHDGIAGCYMIPIAGTTNSGIEMFRWTQRFIIHLGERGYEDGWAFRREDGSRAKAADYRKNLFQKLEVIQSNTNLIDPEVSIWDDYGIQRSGRRMFTTEATKRGASEHLIQLQARWMTDRAVGNRSVQRTMIHTYSEIRNMKDKLSEPSQLL